MILGKHTLDETRDLLAVADYRFKETEKAFDGLKDKPRELADDWNVLKLKWATARQEIVNELRSIAASTPLTPARIVATETQWNKVLSFVQGQELVKGSLQDVTNRIGKLRNKTVDYPNQPAQNSPDVDTTLFKELDSDIKNMEAASAAAKKAVKEAATSNTGLIVGGTVVATLVLVVAAKVYLK